MTESKSNKIQLLRGLAIIAVVFIHNTPIGMAQVFVRPFLNFCVGTFLFLSGMLSTAERWKPGKRIGKVIVPYVLWTLLYVLLYYGSTPAEIPVALVKHLVLANGSAVMYYIFVYCQFTLLIPLVDKLARSKYRYLGFLISPLEILLMRMLPLLTGYEMNAYITLVMNVSCLGWFTYFYLGYLLGNGLLAVRISLPQNAVLLVLSLGLQMLEAYWYFSMGQTNCGSQLKLSCILSGVLFLLLAYRLIQSDRKIDNKLLRSLGDASFGIFFSHMFFMELFKWIPFYSQWVIYPFNAIVAIAVSFLFSVVGKKLLGKYGKYLAL